MAELIHQLGIDWRLIIAQMINFLILMAILYRFAYKPLIKILEERRKKIEKSIDDAKAIEENMSRSMAERQQIVAEARRDAGRIMEETKVIATNHKNAAMAEAKTEAEKIIKNAELVLRSEKESMLTEAKTELAELVVLTTEKVLRGAMNKELNQKYIESVLKEIK